MNIGAVCLLIAVAVTVDCLCIFWLVRKIQANRERLRRPQTARPIRAKPKASVRLLYTQAGYQHSVFILYLIMALLVVVGLGIGKLLHLHPLISGLASVWGASTLPQLHLRIRRHKRQQAFLQQLPNALELMANGLRAGLGINTALEVVAKELEDPLGFEFSQMVTSMNLGGASVEQAMNGLIERNPSTDIRLFVQAVLINKQVGGNLAEVLDNLDRTIRERFWLQRELRAQTAEQRLSAWILGLLPLTIGLIISVLNRDYTMVLVREPLGHYLIGLAVFLLVVGLYSLYRILKVIDF